MSQLNNSLLREIQLSKQAGQPTHRLLQLFEEVANKIYKARWPKGVENTDLERNMFEDTITQLTKSYVQFKPEKCNNAYAFLHCCSVGPMVRAVIKHKTHTQSVYNTKRGIWG